MAGHSSIITEITAAAGTERTTPSKPNSLAPIKMAIITITGESPTELRAREQAGAHALDQVPHCFISAAYRPNLKSAVSEKRRKEAADKTNPEATETSEETK